MSIPLKETLLVPWSSNFNARIAATPAVFGLTAAQAAAFSAVHEPFIAAYEAMMVARADGTRSESQTAAKDTTKEALLAYARELYSLVQASTAVSDADKISLGIHVRSAKRSPIGAPASQPRMGVVSVTARRVSVRISDSETVSKRGKPRGAVSAWVYTFVGTNYPSDESLWQFRGAFNKAEATIELPDTVPGGAMVWLRAAWVSRRGECGPVSIPVSTHIQYGGVSTATGNIKIAA